MKEDHELGTCDLCRKRTMVRWKNIYHMGSEGLTVCMPCEMKIVEFVRGLRSEAMLRKKRTYILEKRQRLEKQAQL